MLKKITLSLALLSLCAVGFGVIPVSAQTDRSKADKKAGKIRKKVERLGKSTAPVRVTTVDNQSFEGALREIGADTFAVVDQKGAARTFNYSEVQSIRGEKSTKGEKAALFAVLGAAAVGAAVAIWYFVKINNN